MGAREVLLMRSMLVRPMLAVAALGLLAAACAPAAPAASPPPAKVQITDKTRSELEFVLARRAEALARGNKQLFEGTIDLARGGAFRRCELEEFDIATRRPFHGGGFDRRIVKLNVFKDVYVQTWVDEGRIGVTRRYFRRDGDRWLLTEPRNAELGGEKKKTVDGLEISYFAIDEDVVDILAKEGLRTRDFLLKQAKRPTRTAFALRFFPTRDSVGFLVSCQSLASATLNDPKDPHLRFYGIYLNSRLDDVSEDMHNSYIHEGLHWLQDQYIAGITARLDWWLMEGWPDYVSGFRRGTTMERVLCKEERSFTLKQMEDGFRAEDPTTPPEVPGQYYAFANAMVEYLLKTFGKDKYWDLLDVYVERVESSFTFPKALGITPQKFYADWLAWAKKDFCEKAKR